MKGRAAGAFRKASSLLSKGEAAEEHCRRMCLLGNPKFYRMNLQGQELRSLGLAYIVHYLGSGVEHRLCRGTIGYSDSKRRL